MAAASTARSTRCGPHCDRRTPGARTAPPAAPALRPAHGANGRQKKGGSDGRLATAAVVAVAQLRRAYSVMQLDRCGCHPGILKTLATSNFRSIT